MGPSIVLIGSAERRALIKQHLGRSAGTIVGEIAGAAAVRLIAGLSPESIVLDGLASGVNPLVVLPALAALAHAPRVIVLASSASPLEHRLLRELGAQAVVRLEQPGSLAAALAAPSHAAGDAEPREQHPSIDQRPTRAA